MSNPAQKCSNDVISAESPHLSNFSAPGAAMTAHALSAALSRVSDPKILRRSSI